MKGLLVKDLKLVKNQGKILILLAIAMGAVFGIMDANPSFVVSYMTIFFTIFTISTISYDEYDNGFAFLLTLPATRQQYVHEKYLFSLIMMGGAWAGGMAVSILLGLIWRPEGGFSELYGTSWIFIILGGSHGICTRSVEAEIRRGKRKTCHTSRMPRRSADLLPCL